MAAAVDPPLGEAVGRALSTRLPIAICSLALLLAVWLAASWASDDPQLLPSPAMVAGLILREAASGDLWRHLFATLARVLAAFVIAMASGMALGLLMGRNTKVDRWLDPWIVVLLNLPALVVIVLCYLWIGLSEVAAVTAVALNKIPMVTVMIREGARALDPQLDDMARIFEMGRMARLRHVTLPQLAPHIAASARAGIALIWKIVLVVEFLGRSNGIGFQIHLYFQLFDVGMVLAYSLSFVLVMLLIEMLVLQPIERRVSHWRTA